MNEVDPLDDLTQMHQEGIASILMLPNASLPSVNELALKYGLDGHSAKGILEGLKDGGFTRSDSEGLPVVARQQWADPPKPVLDSLPAALKRGFEQDHVTVDFAGYTAETLWDALSQTIDALMAAKALPGMITIRVLVPDSGKPMALPYVIRDRKHDGARKRFDNLSQMISVKLQSIKDLQTADYGRLVFQVSLELARIPYFSPMDKIIIINQSEVLTGGYVPVNHRVDLEGKPEVIKDIRGHRINMYRSDEAGFVQEKSVQFNRWFEMADDKVVF